MDNANLEVCRCKASYLSFSLAGDDTGPKLRADLQYKRQVCFNRPDPHEAILFVHSAARTNGILMDKDIFILNQTVV